MNKGNSPADVISSLNLIIMFRLITRAIRTPRATINVSENIRYNSRKLFQHTECSTNPLDDVTSTRQFCSSIKSGCGQVKAKAKAKEFNENDLDDETLKRLRALKLEVGRIL